MTEYMTIPKLAQKLKLSDNTVRRYTKKYSQFFRPEIIEGWEQFPVEDSVRLIQRINTISAAGKRRADVVSQLEQEFEVVRQPDPVNELGNLLGGNLGGTTEFGPETLTVLGRIADALEMLAGKGHAI